MRNLAAKSLVWLAAVLVPLQPLSAASCCCAAPGQLGSDAEKHRGPIDNVARCCRSAQSCRGNADTQIHSCCKATPRESAHADCKCADTCSCQANDTAPPEQQAPAQGRSRVYDQLTQPLSTVSFGLGDLLRSPSLFSSGRPVTASGFERCITLCRFNL